MVNICVSELIMDFSQYKVLRRCQPLLSIGRLEELLELRVHALEYAQALLVPVVDLRKQGVVVGGVLVEQVVLDDDHLQLLHVKTSVHLDGALVHQVDR